MKFYDKVGAPAIPLRVDMHNIEKSLYNTYHAADFESDLHSFFVKINATRSDLELQNAAVEKNSPLSLNLATRFLQVNPSILFNLSDHQMSDLDHIYANSLKKTQSLPAEA